VAEQAFVGREAEQAQFAALLQELAETSGPIRARWSARRPADADAPMRRSRVVLVRGPGGSGKSRLLRQFQAMTGPTSQTAWLSWAQVATWSAGLGAEAEELGIIKVLGAVQWAITRAFTGEDEFDAGRIDFEFREYSSAADRMPEYLGRVREVVQRVGRPGFPCSPSDAATLGRKLNSAGLAIFVGPRESEDPGPDIAEASEPLSPAIAQAVTKRAPGELPPQEYALVTDPATELIRRFAVAVSALATRKPLVVFLDDGELISDLDWQWLRLVMTQTGHRVAWVVAGRFEGGTGGQVERFGADLGERLTLMSPTPFDDSMIRAYLKSRANARDCESEDIELITRCTGGLPLAVSLTATLLDDGATVAQVCDSSGDEAPGSASARLIRRYVAAAEADRGDAAKIVALALAYGTSGDADMLAALWGDSYPLDIFEALASRHDFVLLPSLRLHDDVRDALRSELLDPDLRPVARQASERARRLSLARLESARARWPTLDQQLGHSEFAAALLSALWYSTWISDQDGLDLLAAVLPVLLAASPRIAAIALTITGRFAGTFTPEQKRRLEQLTGMQPDPSGDSAHGPLIGQPEDQQATAHILAARHQAADNRQQEAVASLRSAIATTTSDLLRHVIGGHALAIAAELMRAGPESQAGHRDTSLAAAEIAAGLLPGTVIAWWCYGPALHHAGRAEEALAAHYKALEFHPDDALTHSNIGATLGLLGRFTEAIAAHDRALALAPDDVHVRSNRVAALGALGRLDEALAAAEQAIALDSANAGGSSAWAGAIMWHRGDDAAARQHFARVADCLVRYTPFHKAELEAIARCALGDPDTAAELLLGALPLRSTADKARSHAIYDLLADPPLPGVDRLRAIIDAH
jgi:tetratricopeptide (TPR) repeat protein